MTSPTTREYDPLRGFRTWNINEIYGIGNSGTIVPNIDDLVIDYQHGLFRVIQVDTTSNPPTYVPTLLLVDFSLLAQAQAGSSNSINLPSYQPNVLELAFLNTAVTPFTIDIDDKYRAYGSEINYAKLFLGTDISNTGTVISQTFNGSGSFVSENIEMVTVDSTNPAILRPPTFNTSTAMYDGQIVTLVTYTQSGGPTGEHQFRIKNSNVIKGLGNNVVYIVDVALSSNLLDPTITDTINIPANVPFTGGDFQARLIYNNGTSALISVGTSKCKIFGMDDFNTSIVGSKSKIVLTYYPDSTEAIVNSSNPSNKAISHIYTVNTVSYNSDYSFKVFIVPNWNGTTNTYTNDYYLTNLSHSILIKLTNNQITVTRPNNGTVNYGPSNPQELVLSIIMSRVFVSGYTNYTFTQMATIAYGTPTTTPFIIDYLNNNESVFGNLAYAEYSVLGQQVLSIKSGALSLQQWLTLLYYPIQPIYDQTVSLSPPTPDNFQLIYAGATGPVRDIASYWNILLPNDFSTAWVNGATVSIVWLQSTTDAGVYKTLGVTPVCLRNTLS